MSFAARSPSPLAPRAAPTSTMTSTSTSTIAPEPAMATSASAATSAPSAPIVAAPLTPTRRYDSSCPPAASSSGVEEASTNGEEKEEEEGAGGDAVGASRSIVIGARHILLTNAVQRILSALVLAPLITYFLWVSPAFATTTVCTVVMTLACYEYAWLASRIHFRFVTVVERFEASEQGGPSSLTGSLSSNYANTAPPTTPPSPPVVSPRSTDVAALSVPAAQPSSSPSASPSASPASERGSDSGPESEPHSRWESDSKSELMCDEIVAFKNKKCAVTWLATRFCGGHEWVIAPAISIFGTLLSTTMFLLISGSRSFVTLHFSEFWLYYSIISSFAGWMCACLSPDWKYAVLLVMEKEIFTVLTLYSMKCPLSDINCSGSVNPGVFLLAGVMAILFFRVVTSSSPFSVLLHVMLDVLGFFYITGTLFFIVSFVDLDREATYRKLLIALLYVVWASDSGAYFFGKLFEACHYRHSHPLAIHLSPRKDYEGTAVAICFGMAAMWFAADWMEINGSIPEKLSFAALAVIVGRIGDLFESMLKRAALVKDSGMLIPGHGGMLDRIDALMFASIVFSRYFGAIIYPTEGQHA